MKKARPGMLQFYVFLTSTVTVKISGAVGARESRGVEIGYQELCSSCEVPCCRVAFREGEQNATFLKGFGPGTRGKVTF